MGLFDKVKSMFTEEVQEEPEEEVKVEQIKKEVTHIPIESPNVQPKEEKKEEPKQNKSAILFSDRDFEDLTQPKHVKPQDKKDEYFSKEELARMYGSSQPKAPKQEPKEKTFKPTPIISPIYGILDKNYHKEDIVEKKEDYNMKYQPRANNNVDVVRNKAYGTLEEQLQDEVLNTNKNNNEEKDLFEELVQEKSPIVFHDEAKEEKKSETVTMDLTKELDDLLHKKQESINATTREAKNKDIDILNMLDQEEGDN